MKLKYYVCFVLLYLIPGTHFAADTLYFPTGIKESSPLKIEHFYPQKVEIEKETSFVVRVSNQTDKLIRDISIQISLPSSFIMKSTSEPIEQTVGSVTWKIPSLGGGDVRDLEYAGRYTRTGNTKQTILVYCSQLFRTSLDSDLVAYKRQLPSLDLRMSGVTRAWVKTIFPVTLRVTNKGDGPLQNVQVSLALSDGLELVEGSEVLSMGSLDQGLSREIELRLRSMREGFYQMSAVATSDLVSSAQEIYGIEIGHGGLLMQSKNKVKAVAGMVTPVLFRVMNSGDMEAQFVKVKVEVPEGFSITKVKPYTYEANKALIWNAGNLGVGGHADYSVYGIAEKDGYYDFDISATSVDGGNSALKMGLDSVGVAMTEVDFFDMQDPIQEGKTTMIVAKIRNLGKAQEKNAHVTMQVGAGATFQKMEAVGRSGDFIERTNNSISWQPPQGLAAGEDVELRVELKGESPGEVQVDAKFQFSSLSEAIYRSEKVKVIAP